jgi:hypothetical protein
MRLATFSFTLLVLCGLAVRKIKGRLTVLISTPRKRMKVIGVLFALALSSVCFAQNKSAISELRVDIEATELDKKQLLERLNANSGGHHLKFVASEQDFDYRIEFGTGQKPVATGYGDINASLGSTSVYDAQGKELFEFKREGRWTDSGATNAVAKEIIKRILKLQNKK